jgi:hypothetical protein
MKIEFVHPTRSHLDQGGRYRPHRLTITPGPPPKIHGARDILASRASHRTLSVVGRSVAHKFPASPLEDMSSQAAVARKVRPT